MKYLTTGSRVTHTQSGIKGTITKHTMWDSQSGGFKVTLDSPWQMTPYSSETIIHIFVRFNEVVAV